MQIGTQSCRGSPSTVHSPRAKDVSEGICSSERVKAKQEQRGKLTLDSRVILVHEMALDELDGQG